MAFLDATCPKCGKRFGWTGNKPPCPRCKYQDDPAELAELEAKLDRLTEEMLRDDDSQAGR